MILASIESFLSGIWFTALVGVACYMAGSVFPISTLMSKLTKK
jgi:hypothetical protein